MLFKRHPVGVLRSRGKVSRVHALEIARRAMEKGGEGSMMPLTAAEMPNPLAQGQLPQDPTSQWPGMMASPGMPPPQDPNNPLAALMGGMGGGGNGTPQ